MNDILTIVLVLRSGGDFTFRDVELILYHINTKWNSPTRPRIILLWDEASREYDLGNLKIIPLKSEAPGTWARIQLYSPEMEQYRPFLYVDLDTAIIQSLENIFDLVKDPTQFITLEDFWQRGQLATALVWFPAKSDKILKAWNSFKTSQGPRMDYFLRQVVTPDRFWQRLTDTIHDFKSNKKTLLNDIPLNADLICFHGKPRIFEANVLWVVDYVNQAEAKPLPKGKRVTVIIPYKEDRGWLQQAIDSIPKGVQILLSQGGGNWPENFNKALPQATGDYIKYLHEDDRLSPNCITDSVEALDVQGGDFIHGKAIEFYNGSGRLNHYTPSVEYPRVEDLLRKNTIHSATLMYRRDVFNRLGGFDETLGKGVSEEYEFNLRCLKEGMKIGYCPSVLAYYRRHPLQKIRTTSRIEKIREKEMVKIKYAL